MKLQGKVSIVTGGAARIGKAIAIALAEQGVRICLHYGKSKTEARHTVEAVNSGGGAASAVQADLCQPVEAAEKIVEHALNQFGQVDILVNSAAIFEEGILSTTTEQEWDRHFDINLKAPFFLSQRFITRLRQGQRAHIVNIADWRAIRPGGDHVAYILTKGALVTLTLNLAQELAPNVQVNAIAPGAILPAADTPQSQFEELANQIPLRRTGRPGDVTDALLFLLRSDFITGEIIHLTGGEHL